MSAKDSDTKCTPQAAYPNQIPPSKVYMIIRCFTRRIGAGLLLLSLAVNVFAQPGPVSGKYIVLLKAGVSPATVAARHGVAPDFVYGTAVNGFAGAIPPGRLRALQDDPRVEAIVQDNSVYAFAKPGGGGSSTGQVIPEGVKRIGAAPGSVGVTGAGIGVAVGDTGGGIFNPHLAPLVDAFSFF